MTKNVHDYLIANGVPADSIKSYSLDEREPVVPTADGIAEPLNRVVVVSFQFSK